MLKKITKWETEDGKVFDTQEEAEDDMFEQEKEVMTHTGTEKPASLYYADLLDGGEWINYATRAEAAAELRRLHACVQELKTTVETGKRLLREEMARANRYAEASQARVPLTYTQINSILHSVPEDDDDAEWMLTDAQLLKIIRAAEAAHGITQENQG